MGLQNGQKLLASICLFFLAGCGDDEKSDSRIQSIPGHNLLVITLDTTRADRIGAYGYKEARTPAFDAIAARGVLFEDTLAQVPLTLPSHCTLMTGRHPREFGVRINNGGALGESHSTLASLFKEKGYRTAAFVATFVLDSRFGLDRGFDVYEDEMSNASIRVRSLDWERPANIVADRAITWLEANKSAPFFCWVHFFDPHSPYNPPSNFAQTYDGEIAFADSQIKRVVDWLSRSGLQDKTMLLVLGDHGESFNEHGEEGHGMFLYQTSIRVPMAVAHPTLLPEPRRVAQPVGVVDVFPTIVELFELARPDGLLSSSFAVTMQGGHIPEHEVFSESDYAWISYGWAQQRSLINSDWKFISSTKPELYDRKADPLERNNLFAKRPDISTEMSNRLFHRYSEMVPKQAGRVAPSAAAQAALTALGYTGGGKSHDEFLTAGADDPKDRIDVIVKFATSRKLWGEKKIDQSIQLLEECVRAAPQSPTFQGALGVALVHARRYEDAIQVLDQAIRLDPTYQPGLVASGEAYLQLGKFDKAFQYFTLAVANDPSDATAHFLLGKTLMSLQKPKDAHVQYARAVELLPEFPTAQFELALSFFAARDYPRAIQHFQQTIRLEPNNDNAHFNLGSALAAVERWNEAVEAFRQTVRVNPRHGQAWLQLGHCLLKTGQVSEAKQAYERAMMFPQVAADAYYNLANMASREGEDSVAGTYLQKAIDIAPRHPKAAIELARMHLKHQRIDQAIQVLRAGEMANPSNVGVLDLLASILATANTDSFRDGAEAVRLAKNAVNLTHSSDPVVLKTLAEAYAELGDFPTAVATVRQAISLIPDGQLNELRAELNEALNEYNANRPIRRTAFP